MRWFFEILLTSHMKTNEKLSMNRILFNFTERCNLSCPFCYVPFDASKGNIVLWKRIIDRCKKWNPELLVFGGGDPFIYSDFRELLKYSFDAKMKIHVDTNAIAMRDEDLPVILDCVDRIGLPLDGVYDMHSKIRNNPFHFYRVIHWLDVLKKENIKIKINTMVCEENVKSLIDLGVLLSERYGSVINQWCLYQFWPLARGKQNQNRFLISEKTFNTYAHRIKKSFDFTDIDIASIDDRAHSHFFVSHSGRVYIEGRTDVTEYHELGNIFDHDILARWANFGNFERVVERTRLRTKIALPMLIPSMSD